MRPLPHYDVLGIPVAVTTLDETTGLIVNWSRDAVGRFICVREVASLMACIDNPELVKLHHDAALVVPDGMPFVWIGKMKGLPVERTCGPDLFDRVCRMSPDVGLKHYFYGGKENVAETLANVCRDRYPGIQIVGWECPPFRPLTEEEERAAVARIIDSGADVVWVGISSPKQDIWMHKHYGSLSQTLIGVGAAFDFHSGAVKRAPRWMQRHGLEFLHRLYSEPRRLWRRYLVLAPAFVWRVAISELRKAHSNV